MIATLIEPRACDTIHYPLVQLDTLDHPLARDYWQELIVSNRLIYRIPGVHAPGWKDIRAIVANPASITFLVFDPEHEQFCAECTVENFQGLSCMVHMSMHPGYYGEQAVAIARDGAAQLFRLEDRDGRQLMTLIGLIPESNRLAIRFVQKVGYKVKTVLTNCFILANKGSRVENGVLSQLTKEEFYGQ